MNAWRALAASVVILVALGASRRLEAAAPVFNSHEVNADDSVTFRYYAPAAQKVTVSLDYAHHPVLMTKDAAGLWSLTTPPLAEAWHMYAMAEDGRSVLDPMNLQVDPNLVYKNGLVRVPSRTPQLWDRAPVPHGVIHHHFYHSAVLLGLTDGQEDYYVYTPPGFTAHSAERYPVLYLLHGWAALADSWMVDGQAELILDNLLAQHRIHPMIVVMPQGYGDMAFVRQGSQWNDERKIGHNLDLFEQALLQEILPQVEAAYPTRAGRDGRAVAGLSMGGGQSLVIGLRHPATFGWVGGFSAALEYADFDGVLPVPPRSAPAFRLFWVSCGTGDPLIANHRRFAAWLAGHGLAATVQETPGIHNWLVWRNNLIALAPLLFGGPAAARPTP